jgi:polar amino acid transport system ATP-binding protein
MDLAAFYRPTYFEARALFEEQAAAFGASLHEFASPAPGPNGETLLTTVALACNGTPKNIFVTTSAVHGVEGYYGSACQSAWLATHTLKDLPKDCGIVFIHAMNPYGFAYNRRVTHEGVDLNRNFRDFSKFIPENVGYSALADSLVPRTWAGDIRNAADDILAAAKAHAPEKFQAAVSAGQYHHPKGVFYGGTAPTWSHQTFGDIYDAFIAPTAENIIHIDFHTGWGDYGNLEAYSIVGKTEPNHVRAHNYFSHVMPVMPSPYPVHGSLVEHMLFKSSEQLTVTACAIEVGTMPLPKDTINALRADHFIQAYGCPKSDIGQEITRELKSACAPADHQWKNNVTLVSLRMMDEAMAHLPTDSPTILTPTTQEER